MYYLIVSIFMTSNTSPDYVDKYTFNTYQECKVKREEVLNNQIAPTEAVCTNSSGEDVWEDKE